MHSSGPVAAIDCGTNTIKLLISGPNGDLEREMRMVRLGQDLGRTGRFADEALVRAFTAIDEYADLLTAHDVPPERVRFVATSASRDAANAATFVSGVRERLGVEPEVVTGDEEAALAFAGAMQHLAQRPQWPALVIDVGGGSTELVLGDASGVLASRSIDIGSVRLHERHLHSDPPTEAEVAACVADIDAELDACPVDPAAAAIVVGVAGTVTQLAAVSLGLEAYDRSAVDQAQLAVGNLLVTIDDLVARTVSDRLAIASMHPGRADVIGAGALILERVLRRTQVDVVTVSEADILDGIAASVQSTKSS